jgi:hypothetical protein
MESHDRKAVIIQYIHDRTLRKRLPLQNGDGRTVEQDSQSTTAMTGQLSTAVAREHRQNS